MDKNAIKKYAVWARNELIARVSQKAQQYGITAGGYGDKNADSVNGVLLSATEKKQRQALIAKIDAEGFEQVMEEVAYTWFNRFTALRFMEVNNYLPSHTRVFTNEANEFKPQILADAISLELEGLDMDKVFELKNANKDEELYKYLLIVQCNALSNILPGMFQKIADYTELLLPDYLLREGSVIDQLIYQIPEVNFDTNSEDGQIEIIGWLYQYYISEKHEAVVDPLHGKVVKKEEVPAATQLFTTDWVVRYIIDNSVGRYWIERHPNSKLADDLTYYIAPEEGLKCSNNEKITPQDVTVFDPCIGSGHFAVYAFEVLMKIYVEYGYSEREAAAEIVEHNLYGLDIDSRATQLASFAIMMKARQYDRRFFTRGIQPHVYEIIESNGMDTAAVNYFIGESKEVKSITDYVMRIFTDAKEYGSTLRVEKQNWEAIHDRFNEVNSEISMFSALIGKDFRTMFSVAEILSSKYAVVATNPPYLNKYDEKLKTFIIDNYADYKGDLFSAFIARNYDFCKENGFTGFMTPMVWMFIKTYEKLRELVITEKEITTLIQFEYSAFEEATVPICSFVTKNSKSKEKGCYFRLSDFRGGMEIQKKKVLEALNNRKCGYYYEVHQKNFIEVPGSTIAYWISEALLRDFSVGEVLKIKGDTRQGMATSDNNRFLRLWYEVDYTKLGIGYENPERAAESRKKWFPYNKGGEFRKWYGNIDYTINYENDGKEVKDYATSLYKTPTRTIKSISEYFKPCLSWSKISSGSIAFRYYPQGFIFDVAGCCIFYKNDEDMFYDFGFINSKIVKSILAAISPTLNYEAGHIASLPIIREKDKYDEIVSLTKKNVSIAKEDWDAFETSWDFVRHPLIRSTATIEAAFEEWKNECNHRFVEMKSNEERINELFLQIYGLQDEMSEDVEDKDITVRTADVEREIRSFISYAVGCIFGRYSLSESGIVFAGGEDKGKLKKNTLVDVDGIIPILDDEYFDDDMVHLFVEFVKEVYGQGCLEENLNYIAKALGGKGASRDVIRDYFMNGFYADHIKLYQKRPIYWLFDSGKKNGFKCMIYMHRYQPDTIARIRTDYVHEQQSRYRTALADLEQRINGASTSERVKLNKQFKTIQDQAEELRKYEEKIHHLADQMIAINLDDGVKENYAKFQDVLAKIK